MKPAAYPRRILLAVTGLTPQVVTETIYALAVTADSADRYMPTEVHVITTGEGAQRARLTLLDPTEGRFHSLCRDYALDGVVFPQGNIHVIDSPSGNPLADIRTPGDNLAAADYIVHFIRGFCADPDASLHVSIAGGRKSMGFFAGYALSLFGRAQDRLSHVLVNEPFESLPEFYFPPKTGRLVHTKDGSPAHTSDARIMLADIPFVRLRGGVPQSLLQKEASFRDEVGEIQSQLRLTGLEFDKSKSVIYCGGKPVRLPDSLYAFYLWLATRVATLSPDEAPLNWKEADPREFLEIYNKVLNGLSTRIDSAEQALRRGFEDGKFFEQKASKINSLLKRNLPLEASAYQVVTIGQRPFKRYGLRLTANQIALPE